MSNIFFRCVLLLTVIGTSACSTGAKQNLENTQKQLKSLCISKPRIADSFQVSKSVPSYGSSQPVLSELEAKDVLEEIKPSIQYFLEYIPEKFIADLKPYTVDVTLCQKEVLTSKYEMRFTIYGGGVMSIAMKLRTHVEIIDRSNQKLVWSKSFETVGEAATKSVRTNENIGLLSRSVIWELYQNDWIEKR